MICDQSVHICKHGEVNKTCMADMNREKDDMINNKFKGYNSIKYLYYMIISHNFYHVLNVLEDIDAYYQSTRPQLHQIESIYHQMNYTLCDRNQTCHRHRYLLFIFTSLFTY